MEIKQLEYFLAVSEAKSFTRAAEQLYVSQPSVTNTIRGLETELGLQLFERSQKQAVLTSEGRIFHSHVEHLMRGISHTLDEIQAIKNLSGGVLALGLAPLAGVPDCFALLQAFRESYPGIRLRLVERPAMELQRSLLEGRLDLALLAGGETIPALEYLPLGSLEMAVCFTRRHPLRRHNTLRLAELTQETWILFEDGETWPPVAEALATAPPAERVTAGQVQTMKGLAAAGCGVAFLPEPLCESDNDLAVAALDPPLALPLTLAYRANRHLSHAAEAFLAIARKGERSHA